MTGLPELNARRTPARKGGWLQTFTGRQFWPLDAYPGEVCIEDIAHALANTARYGGHTDGFYSVAQHSVIVSRICRPDNAVWGLLHDAAEAYLGDVPRPIKHGPGMEAFRNAEHRLQCVITRKYGLSEWEPADVKLADAVVLSTERRDLLKPMAAADWRHGVQVAEPLSTPIIPLAPDMAEALFLERWTELTHFTGTPYVPAPMEDGGW